jgi:diguanylate cyclase (GGDEF)-like protein
MSVANVIRCGLRPGDAIGRYGGEEFVAIVAGAGPESARLVAERLRQSVEEMAPPSPGPSRVTISIGTTVFDPRQLEETPQELVRRADVALYSAKRGGRNRVVTIPPGETPPELENKESQHPPRTSIPIPPEPQILISWERHSR